MGKTFIAAALLLTCACSSVRPTSLVVTQHVEHLDALAVAEHPDGTLFVAGYGSPAPTLWKSDDRGANLARSDDRGAKWTTWRLANTAAPAFFPYLIARGRGELAATWFTASSKDMRDLQWHAARVDVRAQPHVTAAPPQSLDSRRPRPGSASGEPFNDPGGEYLGMANRAGFAYWRFAR